MGIRDRKKLSIVYQERQNSMKCTLLAVNIVRDVFFFFYIWFSTSLHQVNETNYNTYFIMVIRVCAESFSR